MKKSKDGMTPVELVTAMCEGNPGGLNVMMAILREAPKIDPNAAMGAPLLALDDMEIHGSRIWMLFKDVCKHDLGDMLALLRVTYDDGGLVSPAELNHAIDNYGEGIDVAAVRSFAENNITGFQKKAVPVPGEQSHTAIIRGLQ